MAYNGMHITAQVTDNAVVEMTDDVITGLGVTTALPGNGSQANVMNNGTNSTDTKHFLDNFHFYQVRNIIIVIQCNSTLALIT